MPNAPAAVADLSADGVHDALAALGERYDASPRFPVDSLALLQTLGLHRRYAPAASGGGPRLSRHSRAPGSGPYTSQSTPTV